MLNTTGIQLCSLGVKKVKTKQKTKQNKTNQNKQQKQKQNKTKQKQKQKKQTPPKKSGYCKVLSLVLLFQEIANGVIFLTTIIPLSENNNM